MARVNGGSIPSGYEYHVVAPDAHEGLTCRFLKAPDFTVAELPPEEIDFSASATFMPLAVAISPYGPMVFTVAARPAFDDGAVAQWLEFICDAEQYAHSEIEVTQIGMLPAVTCDATQQTTDGTTMRMRFLLFEDGGRLFQMSAMAPDLLWAAGLQKMSPMLDSFELREVHGTNVPLRPGEAPPVSSSPPDVASETAEAAPAPADVAPTDVAQEEPRAGLTPEEFAALALADDAAALEPEHPVNANLRDRGVGLVPRVVSTDIALKAAVLAAGAVEGFFRVPLGWHVIDDGRRTLIFDAGGKIQINLSQREHEGASVGEHAHQLIQQYLEVEPDLPFIESSLAGVAAAGVRGANIDGVPLDQVFLVRDMGRTGRHLVARVTAASEDASRALDLAGDIMVTFGTPEGLALG
ncbi:MAG: hypothetical protein ABMA00_04005 [Gemmatimonas sp.]